MIVVGMTLVGAGIALLSSAKLAYRVFDRMLRNGDETYKRLGVPVIWPYESYRSKFRIAMPTVLIIIGAVFLFQGLARM